MSKGKNFLLRLTVEEHGLLESAAKARGQSMNDYIRSCALATTTPDNVVAAASYLSNTLPSIENAVREARSILEQGKKGA